MFCRSLKACDAYPNPQSGQFPNLRRFCAQYLCLRSFSGRYLARMNFFAQFPLRMFFRPCFRLYFCAPVRHCSLFPNNLSGFHFFHIVPLSGNVCCHPY